jgi:hypothetical protein
MDVSRLLLWVLSFYYCFSNVYSHMLAWALECVGMCGILYSALRPNALADYILDLDDDGNGKDPHLHSLHTFLSPPLATPSSPSPTECTPFAAARQPPHVRDRARPRSPILPPPRQEDEDYDDGDGADDYDDGGGDEIEDEKNKRYSRQTIN